MLGEIEGEVVTIRQPRVDGIEVECDGTGKREDMCEGCAEWAVWYRAIGLTVVSVFPISLSLTFAITTRQMIAKPHQMTHARATIPQNQSTSHRYELLSHVSPRQAKKPTLLQSSLHHNPRLKHLRAKPGLIGAD